MQVRRYTARPCTVFYIMIVLLASLEAIKDIMHASVGNVNACRNPHGARETRLATLPSWQPHPWHVAHVFIQNPTQIHGQRATVRCLHGRQHVGALAGAVRMHNELPNRLMSPPSAALDSCLHHDFALTVRPAVAAVACHDSMSAHRGPRGFCPVLGSDVSVTCSVK
jgi:hypothetical protein